MGRDSAARVEELFATLGIADKVSRVAPNVWTLEKGSALVQVVAAPDFVVATAKVAERAPADGREAFYARLLAANQTLLGAFFTLENDGSIRINQVVPVDWLDPPELAFLVANVASQADAWDDKLRVDDKPRPPE